MNIFEMFERVDVLSSNVAKLQRIKDKLEDDKPFYSEYLLICALLEEAEIERDELVEELRAVDVTEVKEAGPYTIKVSYKDDTFDTITGIYRHVVRDDAHYLFKTSDNGIPYVHADCVIERSIVRSIEIVRPIEKAEDSRDDV